MKAIDKNMVTEITISYKPKFDIAERPVVRTGTDALNQFILGFDRETMMIQEEFLVLYLNRANAVLGLFKASKGGLTGTVADTRLILAVGLKLLATSVILAHNHPSGNLNPSLADQELIGKLYEAGRLMDIKVVDHLIVSPTGGCYSFADNGLL